MKNYSDIMQKIRNCDILTDEEWEWIVARVTRKLRDKEMLTTEEICSILMAYYDYQDIVYLTPLEYSYWSVNLILRVANNEFYSITGVYSPELGWKWIPDQICLRTEKREVCVKKWVCI